MARSPRDSNLAARLVIGMIGPKPATKVTMDYNARPDRPWPVWTRPSNPTPRHPGPDTLRA